MLNVCALKAQQHKVTINLNNKPIAELFKQIEAQSGYNFIYSDEVVSDTVMVSVNVSRLPVSKLLDSLLLSKQLSYQVLSESMIVIKNMEFLKNETRLAGTILSGKAVNTEGLALPFVTVSLLENGNRVSGAIGNEDGDFQFSSILKDKKLYVLKISSVGYATLTVNFYHAKNNPLTKEFGKVKLSPLTKTLKEVSVAANQKIIEMSGGNIVFNVAKSISAQGSNALELLSRTPGVTVGTDNNISLNGKAGAAVWIDGKQTYLSGREIAELLKSMSSSDIKSIEIMSSPSAKYDASGTAGIINIKTLKSMVQGFGASLTTGLSYGVYLRNNQDLSLSFRKNRINIYANYSHFFGNYSYLYGADRIQEGKFYNSFTDDIDKRKKIGSRLGADFAIDKNQTVGVLLNGNFIFGGGRTDTRTEIGMASAAADKMLTAINDYYMQHTQRYNVNLNYKYEDTLGRIINFDADYGDFRKGAGNLQSNTYTAINNTVLSDNLYRSLNAIDISLRAVKVDYTTNFLKGKLEIGAKYSSVSADNDSKFLEVQSNGEFLDPSRSNRFAYQEEIVSAYLNYKKKISIWELQGGLRVENSDSNGKLAANSPIAGNAKSTARNYTNFFPYFSATVKPSASNSFSFSYSRRIDRPAYQNLNPFIYLLDELSYWQGNPFLEPQLSHRALLQYVYKSSTILGLSYTYTNNFSVEVTDTVDQTKIVMVPRNLGVQQHLALMLNQSITPSTWWDINFNGTLFGIYNNINFGGNRKLNLNQTAARFSLQQTFKLPYQIKAEVVGFYNSKRLAGANQFAKATSQIDLGLQRGFMNNNASLRLVFSDIYKGSKANSVQRIDGLYIHNYSYFETRQVKLNFSYKFSTGNLKGPRNRSSALENENGRIK